MKTIRFEAREVPDWAEPIDESTLQVGKVYFWLNYFDYDLLMPDFRPVVFVGKEDEGESLLFQEVPSFDAGIRQGSASQSEAGIEVCASGSVNHIFEGNKVIDELLKWSLRWKQHRG